MSNSLIVCEMANHLYHNILLTCEHANNFIPPEYSHYFEGAEDVLNSHRGWDPGAAVLAECLSKSIAAPLVTCNFSRLLIEPNRSEYHPKLFSEFTKTISMAEKSDLLMNFYRPHREKVQDSVYRLISEHGRVLHIGVHTFTPELNGSVRDFGIGLLYDPARLSEKKFAEMWKKELLKQFRVRMNQPYKGKADGLITTLRKIYSEDVYIGIELEANQLNYDQGGEEWKNMCDLLSGSLKKLAGIKQF